MITDLRGKQCEIYRDPEFGFILRYIDSFGRERDQMMEAQNSVEAQLEAMDEGYEVKGVYNE